MDLSKLNVANSNNGETLQLVHPVTCDDLPISITLAGSDSEAFRNKRLEIQNRNVSSMMKNRKKGFESNDIDGCELLASVTLSWSGVEENGKPVECSTENAMDVYRRFPWIREQVDEFVGDRANFFTTS